MLESTFFTGIRLVFRKTSLKAVWLWVYKACSALNKFISSTLHCILTFFVNLFQESRSLITFLVYSVGICCWIFINTCHPCRLFEEPFGKLHIKILLLELSTSFAYLACFGWCPLKLHPNLVTGDHRLPKKSSYLWYNHKKYLLSNVLLKPRRNSNQSFTRYPIPPLDIFLYILNTFDRLNVRWFQLRLINYCVDSPLCVAFQNILLNGFQL